MFKVIKLYKRINTLENENETLKKIIKDELYDAFMNKLYETDEIQRLKDENKRLRRKNEQRKNIMHNNSSINGKTRRNKNSSNTKANR